MILIILVIGYVLYHKIKQDLKHSSIHKVVGLASEFLQYSEQQEIAKQQKIDQQNTLIKQIIQYDSNFSLVVFKDMIYEMVKAYFKIFNDQDEETILKLRSMASEAFMNYYIEEVANLKKHHRFIYDDIDLKSLFIDQVKYEHNQLVILSKVLITYQKKVYDQQGIMKSLKQYQEEYDVEVIKVIDKQAIDIKMNCINCGAVIDMVKDSKCPYCKSIIYKKVNVYLLNKINKKIDNVR